MTTGDQFQELERPMGAFIDDQDDIEPIETRNGHYCHYEDVCKLLRRLKNQLTPAIGIGEPGPAGHRPN